MVQGFFIILYNYKTPCLAASAFTFQIPVNYAPEVYFFHATFTLAIYFMRLPTIFFINFGSIFKISGSECFGSW